MSSDGTHDIIDSNHGNETMKLMAKVLQMLCMLPVADPKGHREGEERITMRRLSLLILLVLLLLISHVTVL